MISRRKQKHCVVYSSLYNKTEHNLMMADMRPKHVIVKLRQAM